MSTKVASRDTRDWVRGRLRAAPVRFDAEAEAVIEAHLGQDVSRWGASSTCWPPPTARAPDLGAADVEPYLGEAGSVAPWDLTDAIDGGRTEEALSPAPAARRRRAPSAGGPGHPAPARAIARCGWTARPSAAKPRPPGHGHRPGRSTYPAKKALASARRWGSARIAEAIGWWPTPNSTSKAPAPGRQRPCSRCWWPGCAAWPAPRRRAPVGGSAPAADGRALSRPRLSGGHRSSLVRQAPSTPWPGRDARVVPTLVAIGVPAVDGQCDQYGGLVPGYLAGQLGPTRRPSSPAALGPAAGGGGPSEGLGGSVLLLVTIPAQAFRTAIPYLILASCGLLWAQDRSGPAGPVRATGPRLLGPPGGPGPAGGRSRRARARLTVDGDNSTARPAPSSW